MRPSPSVLKPSRPRRRSLLIGGLVGLIVLVSAARGHLTPARQPDLSTTRTSEAGPFTAHYRPDRTPVPVGPLQRWTLELSTPGGQPVRGAHIEVGGGMPEHGHSLPTAPTVREAGRPGEYVVDGLRFQMSGLWVVRFSVQAGAVRDAVQFNRRLR